MYSGWRPTKVQGRQQTDKETANRLLYLAKSLSGISVSLLLSKRKTADVAMWRMVVVYVLRTRYNWRLTKIGRLFSNRDHTTIMHSCKVVAAAIENPKVDPKTYEAYTQFLIKSTKING